MFLEIAFTSVCGAMVFRNEYFWLYKRRNWLKRQGIVVGYDGRWDGDGSYFDYPIVEWSLEGMKKQFVSGFSSLSKETGKKVDILVSQDGNSGEVLSLTNRWLFTLFPVLLWLFSFAADNAWN